MQHCCAVVVQDSLFFSDSKSCPTKKNCARYDEHFALVRTARSETTYCSYKSFSGIFSACEDHCWIRNKSTPYLSEKKVLLDLLTEIGFCGDSLGLIMGDMCWDGIEQRGT